MTGYESPQIPGGGEHTDSWEHPQIKDAFDPLNPTDAIDQAERYWKAHQLWEQGVETFARSIQKSIDQAWTGPAATASQNAIREYTTDAHTLTPALAELHSRVRDAAIAIVNTKKAIPDTVDTSFGSRWYNPTRWWQQSEKNEEAQKARDAMNEHYVQPFSQMDSKIPVLPTPTSPTKAVDIPAPPPGGYQSGDGGQPNQSNGTGNETNSNNATTGTNESGTQDQQSGDKSTTDQTTTASTNGTDSQITPASTTSTGTPTSTDQTKTATTSTGTPSSPGTPGNPTTTGVPSGPRGTGTPGSPRGTGTPASPNSTTPQPGRSVPGSPIATGAPTSTTAAAAGARGAAGAHGVGGAGMGAGRGKSDDDDEHNAPDYLITQENTDELLGELPKTLPGGVIGGDNTT